MSPAVVSGAMSDLNRPFGVTLLAFLTLLGGFLYLASALGLFGLTLLADQGEVAAELGPGAPAWMVENSSTVFLLFGLFVLIVAVAFFAVTRGFLRGSGWSWTLAVVVTVLSIVSSTLSAFVYGLGDQVTLMSTVFGLLLAVLILAYLFTDRVRRFFGKL